MLTLSIQEEMQLDRKHGFWTIAKFPPQTGKLGSKGKVLGHMFLALN